MNEKKLNEFMGKLVTDMGGAAMMASVIVGEEIGLYRAMAGGDPTTPELRGRGPTFLEGRPARWSGPHALQPAPRGDAILTPRGAAQRDRWTADRQGNDDRTR